MRPKKGGGKRKVALKTTQEKRDVDIMNTNDSSIVSKRSVSKLYLKDEPDFYEPFVPKFVRRNPLINRGYWLRMHAIEQVVRQFLEEKNGRSKVIVNLGCGYDPLPFQFWHRYAPLTQQATFVDVDYPQLMEKKRDRMLSNSLLRNALLKTKLRSSEAPVYLRSDQYMAIGCDLRELDTLERILRAEFDVPATSILFVAEVSVTYMPVRDADALIRWASTLDDARFCMLEQYLPQGQEHPFAQTMLRHFDKLQTSIQAVKQYSSLARQSSRFLDSGWSKLLIARNLWDLWSDDAFTPPAVRRSLDAVEPFDEWEEFALFGGHYFLLVASNAELRKSTETSNVSTADSCMKPSDAAIISLQSWTQSTTAALTPRRFTAAFASEKDTVVLFGGQGTQARLSSVDVLARENSQLAVQPCTTPPPPARVCHTITPMSNDESLLVGGRGSPTQALTDCWLIKSGTWSSVPGLPKARYRHCAVALALEFEGSQANSVLVFGGKASDGTALDDCNLWTNNGWHSLSVDGPRPPARFGAAMSTMSSAQNWGLLAGGVGADGTVLEDIWEWTVSATPTLCMTFKDRTNNVHGSAPSSAYARVGASLVPWGESLLLIGGVSKKEMHSQSEDFLLLTQKNEEILAEYPVMQLPATWPLLVGMGVAAVSRNEVVIAGGGAVCFSMGSFWNEGYFTITPADTQGPKSWRVAPHQTNGTAHSESKSKLLELPRQSQRGKSKQPKAPRTTKISRLQLRSAEDFSQIVALSKPVIIEGLDLGPCVDLWTLDYLKEKLGPERELIIHKCSSDRMTFKDKNFQYAKESVADFLDGIAQGSQAYLRAVSSSQANKLPTKLEDDFPTIAADFRIPDVFDIVKSRYHSSPLRISGPVSLWLHYDVLANILCQIRGTKTLYLYPPSDVKYLDFPAGGSSSNIDVLTAKDPILRRTHPHVALLKPGDVLFIPPMWSHTATPEEGVSVAVNVFWRDLEKGYAAGKDVYGNRDLQAYENGRRDVEKILKAFKDVPSDIAGFYLERLAGEIQEKAEKLEVKKERPEEK
ncbi:LCM-domain-containing protein [Cucurbitaria berberidis CBS 394.84]|uniref:tRNA wybutosine-synthesizing protein 4 n=1 Tax=Cucurbitaria berberidis CBS 394.84 TaxID=1168544 RepID=A0A9P4GK70_9PLEO|nr:LCM-domain-containing protein [Cucurbitaria berberidis CBS 394.84]KAF1846610.1 LCM-domain-containing protein [Cucurbitaria berberidis CBS 394.84]